VDSAAGPERHRVALATLRDLPPFPGLNVSTL
jgi:hypothetical protein